MPDTLCRLAIHVVGCPGREGSPAVELILPADCPVGVLIPSIVDVALPGPARLAEPRSWHLSRIGGDPLESSKTLHESAVHDGDMLLLTPVALLVPHRRPRTPGTVVAEAAAADASTLPRTAVAAAVLAGTIISAAAMAWSGATSGTSAHLWTAATLSAAAAAVAVVAGRTEHRLCAVARLGAVLFAVVTGFLAVPAAAWAPAALLAASSGFAMTILLLRMTSGGTATLTALAASTGSIAAVGGICVRIDPSLAVAGAILTVLSLGALSTAPKMTVAATRLGPSRPDIGHRRATVAHRVLTGLVTGWSAAAAFGVVAVAADAVRTHSSATLAGLFAADVAVLLLLRQRTHICVGRRVALGAAGLGALTAAFCVAVSASPEHTYWFCLAAALAGAGALHSSVTSISPNPIVRHGLQVLECIALAAAIPLAAWVSGLYGVVRDLSLA